MSAITKFIAAIMTLTFCIIQITMFHGFDSKYTTPCFLVQKAGDDLRKKKLSIIIVEKKKHWKITSSQMVFAFDLQPSIIEGPTEGCLALVRTLHLHHGPEQPKIQTLALDQRMIICSDIRLEP